MVLKENDILKKRRDWPVTLEAIYDALKKQYNFLDINLSHYQSEYFS
jgi:hypothetical protein